MKTHVGEGSFCNLGKEVSVIWEMNAELILASQGFLRLQARKPENTSHLTCELVDLPKISICVTEHPCG